MLRAALAMLVLVTGCGHDRLDRTGGGESPEPVDLQGELDVIGFAAASYAATAGDTVEVVLLRTGALAGPLAATVQVSGGVQGLAYTAPASDSVTVDFAEQQASATIDYFWWEH